MSGAVSCFQLHKQKCRFTPISHHISIMKYFVCQKLLNQLESSCFQIPSCSSVVFFYSLIIVPLTGCVPVRLKENKPKTILLLRLHLPVAMVFGGLYEVNIFLLLNCPNCILWIVQVCLLKPSTFSSRSEQFP